MIVITHSNPFIEFPSPAITSNLVISLSGTFVGANVSSNSTNIVDTSYTTWNIVANNVYANNAISTATSNTAYLLYYNNTLYNQNVNGAWSSWNGSSWSGAVSDPLPTSINGATSPSLTYLVDGTGNLWTVNGGI